MQIVGFELERLPRQPHVEGGRWRSDVGRRSEGINIRVPDYGLAGVGHRQRLADLARVDERCGWTTAGVVDQQHRRVVDQSHQPLRLANSG